MAWVSLAQRLDSLPLILAGPILRRTESKSVTVWVALKAARKVTLEILDSTGKVMFSGVRHTYQVGKNLHVVAVTAQALSDGKDTELEPGKLYFYDMDFEDQKVSDLSSFSDRIFYFYTKISIINKVSRCPSFVLPASDINKLRLLHGSCRKPHGEQKDVLATVDGIIASSIKSNSLDVTERPQQLFLTGDQIYADDVSYVLLFMLMDASKVLLGWSKEESFGDDENELIPTMRARFIKKEVGLSAEPEYTHSHLLRFGEFCAMYLFVWSDVLWPSTYPNQSEIFFPYERYGSVGTHLDKFRKDLPSIRRALANIPTYMTPDDHEVTDDWNVNLEWCKSVYGKPLGRTLIQNALAAFAIFQGWGNTPGKFSENESGGKLLKAVETWSQNNGSDSSSRKIINDCVGVPDDIDNTFKSGSTKISPSTNAIRWDYYLDFPNYEVIGLDTRCFRSFAGKFPILLGADGFKKQLRDRTPKNKELTIVISAAPIVFAEQIEAYQRSDPLGLDAESWGQQISALSEVLAALAERGMDNPIRETRVVVLSGDVHSSATAKLQYRATAPYNSPVKSDINHYRMDLAQLISSALQNEDEKTRALHQTGYKDWKLTIPPLGGLGGLGSHIYNFEHHGWKNLSGGVLDVGKETVIAEVVFPYSLTLSGKPAVLKINSEDFTSGYELKIKPEWSYLVTLMGDNVVRSETKEPKIPVQPPPPGNREEALKQYLFMAKNHSDYSPATGLGREIVGVNNLGEVTFTWPAGDNKKSVTHSLWWRLESKKGGVLPAFPLTTCTVLLDLVPTPPFKAILPKP